MEIVLASFGFLLAALCAGVMGFAIQRGATCTVVAVDEVLDKRSVRRLAAMVEASLWVAGGLLIARALGVLGRMPAGYPLTSWTLLGGALLGLGAFVNGACVFGAIARMGTGEWAYLATPVGFYVGCLTFPLLFALSAPNALSYGSPVLQAPAWAALLAAAIAIWRILRPSFAVHARLSASQSLGGWHKELAALVWAPHAATTIIGLAFVLMLLLVGAWSYTDALAALARGMTASLVGRTALLLALLLGAVLGGWTAGRLAKRPIRVAQLAKCFTGGAIMAWGGMLVPGSNDGLVLLGMPLLWPYAWSAFLAMCVSIAAAGLARPYLRDLSRMARPRADAGPG